MVTRKMISRTSITSTSGVVLMLVLIASSPPGLPTLIAIVVLRLLERYGLLALGDEVGLQVAGKAAQLLGDHLVAADQEVIEQHGRNRDRQTEGGHDQRFTHRTGNLVDRGLTGNADRDQ